MAYGDDISKGYGQLFDYAGQGIQAVGGWMEQAAKEANGGPTVEMTPQQRALYERRHGKQPPRVKSKNTSKNNQSKPANQYRDRDFTGITRMGGVTYDLSIPHHRELYAAAQKKDQETRPDQKVADIRGNNPTETAETVVTVTDRNTPPPQQNPNGVDQKGTNTGFSGSGFSEANDLLETLGITTSRYGDFQSNSLPTVNDSAGSKVTGPDGAEMPMETEVWSEEAGGLVPVEAKQTEGSPKLTQSGATQTTKPVETAPLGSRERYAQEFLADRPQMPAKYSESMTGLRAAEASKGLLYASGKYWKANPNAGAEGEKDFVEINKAEWNTIKRGGQHATQYEKPAENIADTDTSTDVWKQSAEDFKNDYVGLVQQTMKGTDPKVGYTLADEATPTAPIDRTAAVTNNVTENAPTLTTAVDVRFTDKDRTGRYNNFRNR